ncbi:SRPBCC family protein [Streptomyces sp. NPDC006530]|uniref:SRPBCC family protein n=1 Tax=Streptomyces sp. NPDC006530 TaxID=3364750 RepID=UPI0036904000
MNGHRSSVRATLFAVPLALAVLGATTGPAGAASRPTGSLTCRGEGVDPGAAVRYRTETVIHAPLGVIWKLQTDVRNWPSWQAPVATMERLYHGPMRPGSAFRWTTPVPANPSTPATTLSITSTVRQIKHHACIRWTGPATGEGLHIDGVHVWDFTKVEGGVLVRTEETHTGPQVDANVPAATKLLGDGLEGWLRSLKTTAEGTRSPATALARAAVAG